jgi:hypothetical protein
MHYVIKQIQRLEFVDRRDVVKRTDLGFPDRRNKIRYPLELSLRYQAILPNLHYGPFERGRTVNFASHSFLVSTDALVPMMGAKVRVRVDWPVALDGKLPLQFIVAGRVARIAGNNFAVVFNRHEFRVMKKAPEFIFNQAFRRQLGST